MRYAATCAVVFVFLGGFVSCRESPAAPSLTATCSAIPPSGPAPLTVVFALNVAGGTGTIETRIDYGDGSTGIEPGQPHVYVRPGSYAAAFSITSGEQSALCTVPVRVDGAPATPTPGPTPTPFGPNQAPFAVFRTSPTPPPGDVYTGSRAVTIEFNMCRTSDPENDPLNFTMDFEGNGSIEVNGGTGGDCRRTTTYTVLGRYAPRICVTDLNTGLQPAHPYQCKTYSVRVGPP